MPRTKENPKFNKNENKKNLATINYKPPSVAVGKPKAMQTINSLIFAQ
jgi:hypothetical protein